MIECKLEILLLIPLFVLHRHLFVVHAEDEGRLQFLVLIGPNPHEHSNAVFFHWLG